MSAAPKPPPLPTRTPSTLSIREVIPVETALKNLNEAADELSKTQDHITFSTVLDLHTSSAYNRYSFADQNKLLQGLEVLFEKNSELASDIAWDAIPILLKFAARPVDRESEDAEDQKAVVVRADLLLDQCANNGNSKEVFLVITGKIKNLIFKRVEEEDIDSENEDDEDGDFTPRQKVSPTALATAKILLRLLVQVQKRLKMKTPSRFLATSLMSLLSMITNASQSLPVTTLCDIMDQIIEFVVSLTPAKGDSDADIPIQIKLIQAFITHGIEAFLTLPQEDPTMMGWASAWDKKVRPEKIVPKAVVTHDSHGHSVAAAPGENTQDKLAVGQVIVAFLSLSDSVDMDVESLLQICLNADLTPEVEPVEPEEPGSPTAPTSAEEIPLSYVGTLLLFAAKLNRKVLKEEDLSALNLRIFPEHANLTAKFVTDGAAGAVIDAMIFIGSWIVKESNKLGDISKLGDIPSNDDDFFLYLQIYSALSATLPDPDLRSLTFLHAITILSLNPREELRLAFIKDTLEHCPFEALKAAIIGYLKDEIVAALKQKGSDKESIFLSPIILDSLLLSLFPDYEDEFLKRDLREGWVRFNEAYSTISATANLYYLIWANDDLRNHLSVSRPDWTTEIQRRWVDVVKKSITTFKNAGKGEGTGEQDLQKDIQGSSVDLDMLSYLLDRLDEIRQQKSL